MKEKIIIKILLVLLVGYNIAAGEDMSKMENIEVKEISSGMKLAIWEDHRSQVVELRIYIKAGSVYEQEYLGAGISHFLEHVTAEGPTLKRSKKEIDSLLMKFGNAFNAYTTKDHTCYHITTTNEFYKEAIEVLCELVFESEITEEAYKREHGVILREIEKSNEEPKRYLYKLTSENLYRVHPSRFPVIGYTELFKKIKLEDLTKYYKRMYVPGNAVMVVGGDVNSDEITKIIQRKFSSYEKAFYSLPLLPDEPDVLVRREKNGVMDVEGSYLDLSWLTIPIYHQDLYSLDLLSETLSSGRSARLNKIIKEDKQIVNSIASYSHTPSYGKGEFTVMARFKDSSDKEVEKEILEIIKDIKKNGVLEEELKVAKKLALSSYLFGRTSVTGNTARIGVDIVSTGDENFSYKYIDSLKKVTAREVQNAAKKYLSDNYAKTLVTSENKEVVSADKKDMINSTEKPAKFVLDNGIRLIVKNIPGISVVNYSLFLKGGQTYENEFDLPGLFSFYSSMLSRGTKKHTKKELDEEFEKRGASFSTSGGSNTFFIKAASLKEDYEEILELINEMICLPAFNENEITKLKKFTKQAIQQQNNDWQREAFLNFKKHIFPEETPYVFSKLGTAASIEKIEKEILYKVHDKFVIPGNMVISIVGYIDVDLIKIKISRLLRRLKNKGNNIPDSESKILELDKPVEKKYISGKELSVIFRGFPTVAVDDTETRVLLDIIDAFISGCSYPSGWLHERLRSEELVYVVHAYNMNFIKSGCFSLFAATNPEKLPRAIDVIDGVIADLVSGKYTDDEIKQAKDQIITMHKLQQQTPASEAEDYALNEILGFGYNYDDEYLQMIKDAKREDIETVVKKYFRNPVTVITSPTNSE